MNGGFWDGADVVHVYTRTQALDDGFLVDVSELAREAGWRWPVALTRTAWADAVAWDGDGWQDETGRLWDVLYVAAHVAKRSPAGTDRFGFDVLRVPNRPRCTTPRRCRLVAHVGPGDDGAPVVTVMVPGED